MSGNQMEHHSYIQLLGDVNGVMANGKHFILCLERTVKTLEKSKTMFESFGKHCRDIAKELEPELLAESKGLCKTVTEFRAKFNSLSEVTNRISTSMGKALQDAKDTKTQASAKHQKLVDETRRLEKDKERLMASVLKFKNNYHAIGHELEALRAKADKISPADPNSLTARLKAEGAQTNFKTAEIIYADASQKALDFVVVYHSGLKSMLDQFEKNDLCVLTKLKSYYSECANHVKEAGERLLACGSSLDSHIVSTDLQNDLQQFIKRRLCPSEDWGLFVNFEPFTFRDGPSGRVGSPAAAAPKESKPLLKTCAVVDVEASNRLTNAIRLIPSTMCLESGIEDLYECCEVVKRFVKEHGSIERAKLKICTSLENAAHHDFLSQIFKIPDEDVEDSYVSIINIRVGEGHQQPRVVVTRKGLFTTAGERLLSSKQIQELPSCPESPRNEPVTLPKDNIQYRWLEFVGKIASSSYTDADSTEKEDLLNSLSSAKSRVSLGRALTLRRVAGTQLSKGAYDTVKEIVQRALDACCDASDYASGSVLMNMCQTFYTVIDGRPYYLTIDLKRHQIFHVEEFWKIMLRLALTAEYSKQADPTEESLQNVNFSQVSTMGFNMIQFGVARPLVLKVIAECCTMQNMPDELHSTIMEELSRVKEEVFE